MKVFLATICLILVLSQVLAFGGNGQCQQRGERCSYSGRMKCCSGLYCDNQFGMSQCKRRNGGGGGSGGGGGGIGGRCQQQGDRCSYSGRMKCCSGLYCDTKFGMSQCKRRNGGGGSGGGGGGGWGGGGGNNQCKRNNERCERTGRRRCCPGLQCSGRNNNRRCRRTYN